MKINPIVRRFYSKKSLDNLNNKIQKLGINNKLNINRFLVGKLVILILLFVVILALSKKGYVIAPIAVVATYFLYDYVFLELKIKKRINLLEHDAIFFFEVLALTLQNETNLKLCLEITTNSIDSELSTEFKEVLKEVKLGKSLNEGLENLKDRIPSKAVNNIILNVIEANIYGNSIVDALNNQVEYITDKRILEIKGQINKLPTKISVVSVVFFVPIVILLVLAPILINYFVK